jgi:hypothetical protein
MSNGAFVKDPGARVDYAVDWDAGYLTRNGVTLTIAASAFSVTPVEPGGVTIASQSFTAGKTNVVLIGGIAGHLYQITNNITMSNGNTDERSLLIRVENR